MTLGPDFRFSLLDEPLIHYRSVSSKQTISASLPQLLSALAADDVRDFPALRPHQRHPWHAFLVQLAAIALHRAGRSQPFASAEEWRTNLMALTPDDPDGAAWHLVSPADRPAFMQAPVIGGSVKTWKSVSFAADEIDMLVTSRNHDLKSGRMRRASPQDWLFALLSLQTQEGVMGSGKYGISRMNKGLGSRPGVGVAGTGQTGTRWSRDVSALLKRRKQVAEERGLKETDGVALVWLQPWDGQSALAFSALDPYYIELCRQIRLRCEGDRLVADGTGSKSERISAKELNGITGDPWTPVDLAAGKALTIAAEGFHYKLVAELLFGGKYLAPIAQDFTSSEEGLQYVLIAQGVTRGQGKTEGYHERRVPISPKARTLLFGGHKEALAKPASERIRAIAEVRKLLWLALTVLFSNGEPGCDSSDSVKDKASEFSRPFEKAEDARFFDDLNQEIEADDPAAQRLRWMTELAERAESVLQSAFARGPRSGIQRYRARAAALSRFRAALRGEKSPLPDLAHHYRQQAAAPQEQHRDVL